MSGRATHDAISTVAGGLDYPRHHVQPTIHRKRRTAWLANFDQSITSAADVVGAGDFAEEVGAAVAALGDEVAELVAGVDGGDGFGACGALVAGEDG